MTVTHETLAPSPSGLPWVSLHGIRTVAGHEFRVRLRAGRWRWLLAFWFLVLTGFTALLRWAIERADPEAPDPGVPMFGGLMLLLLGLSLLVVPALTAQSVNGDRERGVLATLQVTLLSPAEIALGKLLAAWGVSLVFLATMLPLVAWAMTQGGVGIARVAVTLLVVAVLLGVVCALAQCLSALLARTMTSAVLSYLTVFALTVGTLIVFGLSLAATTETRTVTERVPAYDLTTGEPIPGQTRLETFTYTEVRPERVWWLLAPNPFVILADAAPQAEPRIDPRTGEELPRPFDPLGEIGRAVREARDPYRPGDIAAVDIAPTSPPYRPGPVWPYGLAFHLVLGVGAVALTVRRLRTPTRNLPRGVRVA
jgi:ABC-type transport system involved in multi-copper enzyme maturation permease subunit